MLERVHDKSVCRTNIFRKVYDNPEFANVLEYKAKLPHFPMLVDIEATNNCMLDCIFCTRRVMTRQKGFIAEDVFRKVIDECAAHGAMARIIRWGEPFLHPKILEFIEYAKKKGVPIHVTTNGLLLKDETIERLIALELDSIIFSFQGATKAEYEIMRNNRRYDELAGIISRFSELRGEKEKPYMHISTTVTNESKEDIDKFVRSWSLHVDSVGVGKTDLERVVILNNSGTHHLKDVKAVMEKETIKRVRRPCKEVYNKLSVNFDGSVSACCSDFNNYLLVGDLRESSLEDIWNHSELLKCFRKILDSKNHSSLTLCNACYPKYDSF